MAHEYGRLWRVQIGDGAGGWNNIGGEGQWDKKVSTEQVDFSSKDDGRIKSMGWGQQSVTLSVQGKVKLPDAGLQQAYTISNADTPEIPVRLVKGAAVKWSCVCGIGNFSMSGPSGGSVTFSLDASAVQDPDVDDLAA